MLLSDGNLNASTVSPIRWDSGLGLLTGTQPAASEADSLYQVGSRQSLTQTVPGICEAWNIVGAKKIPMKKLPTWRRVKMKTNISSVGLAHDCNVVFKEGYIFSWRLLSRDH